MRIGFFLFIFISNLSFGQDLNIINAKKKKDSSSFAKNLHMRLETTVALKQNDDGEVIGTNNNHQLRFDYRFNWTHDIALINGWNSRYRQDEDFESSHDYIQVNYNRRKILNIKDDGVDVRFQARASYTTNKELQDMYGSYGIAEVRGFWGLPLFGRFSINRWITYFRLQKYFIKDNNPRARDIGWRARISPSYSFWRGFDASVLTTYSGYLDNSSEVSQEAEVGPSIRYQWGRVAVILAANFTVMKTNWKTKTFEVVKGAWDSPEWITNITYFTF